MYFNPCKVPTGFQLGTGFLTPCGETDNYAVDCGCDLQCLCLCVYGGTHLCVAQGDDDILFYLSVMFTMVTLLAVSNDPS